MGWGDGSKLTQYRLFSYFIILTHLFPINSLSWVIEPWLHVGYFFLGGYIGQRWVNLEKELVMDINEIRADKGLPPMVATNAWIKYEKPE